MTLTVRQPAPYPAMTPTPADFIDLFHGQALTLLVLFERRVDDPDVAIDLVATTFSAMIAQRNECAARSEGDLVAWLWRVARETLTEHQRQAAAATSPGEFGRRTADAPGRTPRRRALSAGEIGEIERLAGIEQLRREALRKLGELPPQLRDPVRLRIVHECSYEEIADRLAITGGQARAYVWQGLAEIVDRIDGVDGHDGGDGIAGIDGIEGEVSGR